MAFTELTCDEALLPLEEMERRSMFQLPDGTWAQQVVIVAAPLAGGDFNDDFSDDFNI